MNINLNMLIFLIACFIFAESDLVAQRLNCEIKVDIPRLEANDRDAMSRAKKTVLKTRVIP